jgi:ABC-type polysaccharide/polyol phosphate transport system ATPase subunit
LQTGSDLAEVEFINVSKRFQLTEGGSLREFLPALFKGRGFTEPFYALRDVSFTIRQGETVGIVGRNGSGKSTILKLIAGVMAPSAGDVRVYGRVSPLIELGAGFHPDLTGRENVHMNASILGMSSKEIKAQFQAIVDFAELWDFIDTPVKRYSSGMYIRLPAAAPEPGDLLERGCRWGTRTREVLGRCTSSRRRGRRWCWFRTAWTWCRASASECSS